MFRRTWAVAVAALLLVFGTAVSATACPRALDHHVRATASGQISYDSDNPRGCSDPLFPFTTLIQASERATHLGAFTVAASHCETATGAASGQSYRGRMTLTAANGDRTTGRYVTEWVVRDGTVLVTGWLRVTGGTGRFAHATGEAVAGPRHHVDEPAAAVARADELHGNAALLT